MDSQFIYLIRCSQITLASISCLLDFIIICFFIRAKLKSKATTGFELIFYLSICNFIKQVAYTLNWEDQVLRFDSEKKKYSDVPNQINYFNDNFSNIDNENIEKDYFLYQFNNDEVNKYNNLQLKNSTLFSLNNILLRELIEENSNKTVTNISNICLIQGAFMIHSDLSIYSVASLISLFTLITINEFSNSIQWKNRILLFIIGYLFPMFMGIYSAISEKIGPNKYWCWIQENENNFILLNYIFVWFFIFANFIISFKIMRYQYDKYWNTDQAKQNKYYSKKIIIYPVISVLFWCIYTINRIMQDYLNDSVYSFSICIIYLNNIEGLLYASIAANGININKKIKKLFKKVFYSDNSEDNRSSALQYEDLLNETKSKADFNIDKEPSILMN